jgi:hypothetical protein
LFEKSDSRGVDASGYWGVETGSNGSIVFHKEPIRSRDFVKKDNWQNISKINLNILLCHSRGASKGFGDPSQNKNNHPFINSDESLALIHNGRIDDCEYHALKKKYAVYSDCDSEILLRIIENSENNQDENDYSEIISGIKEVYSLINEGHMAVAVGKKGNDSERHLWLFRNQHRPLWVIDTRESLGQVFFISDPNIWEESIRDSNLFKGIAKSHKLIEIPENQIWYFKTSCDIKHIKSVVKFEVEKGEKKPWNFDGKRFELKNVKVEQPIPLKEKKEIMENNFLNLRLDLLDKKCDQIIDVVNNIRQYAEQLAVENSISKIEYEALLADMESKRKELEEMSLIINR